MRITLIRHGAADDDAPTDDERPLTRAGRQVSRKVGRVLARRRVRFDVVFSSPLVRAVQTAEIVAAEVVFRGAITVDRALRPGGPPAGVIGLLERCDRGARVALVAHEPILSSIAARLLGRERFRALEKSEALRIRMTDDLDRPGALRWRVDPKALRLEKQA